MDIFFQAFPLTTWTDGVECVDIVRKLVKARCVTRVDLERATQRLRTLYGRDNVRDVLFTLRKIMEKQTYKRAKMFGLPKQYGTRGTFTSVLLENCRRRCPRFPVSLIRRFAPELRRTDLDRALTALGVPSISSWPWSPQRAIADRLYHEFIYSDFVRDVTVTDVTNMARRITNEYDAVQPW